MKLTTYEEKEQFVKATDIPVGRAAVALTTKSPHILLRVRDDYFLVQDDAICDCILTHRAVITEDRKYRLLPAGTTIKLTV